MKYDAITIDTNLFHTYGLHLEGGMLAQLFQFKNGPTQFVLSEIVARELHMHLAKTAGKARESLQGALKDALSQRIASKAEAGALQEALAKGPLPKDAAKSRLAEFIGKSGAEIVQADDLAVKDLLRMYFEAMAPFEDSGKKKSEFPDAIALLSLEAWAKKNDKKILAVSKDMGWAEFAKTCAHIDVVNDLAEALQHLQTDLQHAAEIAHGTIETIEKGVRADLADAFESRLRDAVSMMSPYIEGDGPMDFEAELVEITMKDYRFAGDAADYSFTIVRAGTSTIVVQIPVRVRAVAVADFSFRIWDSGDHEYIPFDSSTAEREIRFEAEALVTLEGDFEASDIAGDISDVDLLGSPKAINFGYVDMDPEDHGYEE